MSTVLDRLGRGGEAVLTRLLTGPTAQKIERELAVEELAKRRSAAAEVERLQLEIERVAPTLAASVEKAAAEVRKAEAALKVAMERHRAAVGERQTGLFRLEHEQSRQRRILAELAPAAIDDFLSELHEIEERVREQPIAHAMEVGARIPLFAEDRRAAEAERKVFADLHAARLRRIEAIRAVRPQAEALRFSALDQAELAARFATMRDAIEAT